MKNSKTDEVSEVSSGWSSGGEDEETDYSEEEKTQKEHQAQRGVEK